MSPRNADYHMDLAQAYFRQANLDQALESFQQARDLGHSGAARSIEAVQARIAEREGTP
jgi:cytochrome c-type biogenesis protein CcmH/NrfG